MQFKPTQQAAIDHLGSNVIVPASAGAGKTAVLINRLMKRILVDRVELDEICAMTFTDAAASEMKVRLMKALNEAYEKEPSDFITKQISLLETAHISTIHSFCLTIVKNYGYIIGINPDQTQNIMPPSELVILQEQLIKKVLDDFMLSDYEEAQYLLTVFNSNPLNFSALENAVLEVAHWLQEQSRQTLATKQLLADYSINSLDELSPTYLRYFYHYYSLEVSNVIQYLSGTLDEVDGELQEKSTPKLEEGSAHLSSKLSQLLGVQRLIENRDISFYDQLPDALNIQLPRVSKNDDFKEVSKLLETSIKGLIERHVPSDIAIQQLHDQKPIVERLIMLAKTYLDQVATEKKALKVLDFSDFEPMALRILQAENGAVAKLMKAQFKEIMVDEFQDTNSYQDEIIRLISDGSNIFRVGDVKQAIYGFRGGKPAIMQSIIQNKEADMIPISYNFRSKYDIVNFNNVTFKNIMDLTLNTKYTPQDIVETGIDSQSENSKKVEFHIVTTDETIEEDEDYHEDFSEETVDDGTKENLDPANMISARYIAQQIIKMVQNGEAKFKDITILVRAHHLKDLLKEAFDEVNIPYFLNEQSGFYKSDVVDATITILNYLQLQDDHYLAKLLISPFFNLTLDQLTKLKLSGNPLKIELEKQHPSLYYELENLLKIKNNSDIVSLIQAIIALNDTYNTVFSIQDKTNMDALLAKAVEYQTNNAMTITGFSDYLASLQDEKSSEASPISSDEDVVTAMTIHQSKGLQFPVVFLFGLGNQRSREAREFLVCDDDLGFVFNHIETEYRFTNHTLLRKIMTHKRNHDEIEETMRLLYVALTRAQERMFIVDTVKEFTDDDIHADLTEELLFRHKRKVHLLVPASAQTAIVETINFEDMTDFVYETSDLEPKTPYLSLDSHLKFEPMALLPIDNSELNLDRSHIHAMDYGTRIHESIENLPNALWSDQDLAQVDRQLHTRLKRYNSHKTTENIYDSHHTFHHELPFIIRTDDGIENGIMDYVAISDDKITLVDFKTDNASEQEIRDRYLEQIQGYKKALDILYPGRTVHTYIYSFNLDSYIEI